MKGAKKVSKAPRKGRGLKSRVPRLIKGASQYANIVETYKVGPVKANVGQKISVAGLTGFLRAQALARQFQLYRIAKVELDIKPIYDTYLPGAAPVAGPTSVPYFYWQMVRDGDYPTTPLVGYFEQRGSKPQRLDDKIIKINWKPNTLLEVSGGAFAANNGNVKMTPWLSCDASQGAAWSPNATPHHGMVLAAYCSGTGDYFVMDITMRVHYQFKKPHAQDAQTGGPALNDCTPTGYLEIFDASGNSLDNPSFHR